MHLLFSSNLKKTFFGSAVFKSLFIFERLLYLFCHPQIVDGFIKSSGTRPVRRAQSGIAYLL